MLFFGLILQLSVLAVYGIDPDFPADDGEPILVQIVSMAHYIIILGLT